MSGSSVYDELVEHLNSMPVGAPRTPELIEILKTLYTEQQAALAVKLPVLPMGELVMKVMADKKREFKF